MSPGNASSTVVRCGAEHRLGVLRGERPPGGRVGEHHAALEAARADADERHAVAVRAVHARLHLEHQARRAAWSSGRGVALGVRRGLPAAGARSTSASSSRPTPKPCSAAPNSTGVATPARKSFSSNSAPISASSASSSAALPPGVRLLGGGPLRRHDLDLAAGGAARGAGEAAQLARLDLDHAAQVARDPERPGDRHGAQADRLLHLVEQLQRLAAGAVPLVDERQHGEACGSGRRRTA